MATSSDQAVASLSDRRFFAPANKNKANPNRLAAASPAATVANCLASASNASESGLNPPSLSGFAIRGNAAI